jgi:ABC-type branched-subunit amino acid transport system permease subunit
VSHFLLMAVHAAILATFFALLSREPAPRRKRLFLKMLTIMVGGGVILAWLFFYFPSGPPAPIP